jgi:hypothetical protein
LFAEIPDSPAGRQLRWYLDRIRSAGAGSLFTSEASAGFDRVRALASEVERFVVISFGIPEPPGAASRGLYVDPIYF